MSSSCDRVFCTMLYTVVAVCLEMLLNVEKYGNSGAVRNGNGRGASHSIRKDSWGGIGQAGVRRKSWELGSSILG